MGGRREMKMVVRKGPESGRKRVFYITGRRENNFHRQREPGQASIGQAKKRRGAINGSEVNHEDVGSLNQLGTGMGTDDWPLGTSQKQSGLKGRDGDQGAAAGRTAASERGLEGMQNVF